MIFQAILAVVLISTTTGEEAKGDVSFWMDEVTLTCPKEGEWFKANGKKEDTVAKKEFTYEYKDKGQYYCKYTSDGDETTYYYFYIEGRACKSCFELDGLVFIVVIVADVTVTVLFMAIVFKCTKKKAVRPQHTTKAARSRVDVPHNSPYEALNLNTRSSEYSTVINRTG